MLRHTTESGREAAWKLADIPFHRIDKVRLVNDEKLFFVLAGASFVESGSAIYSQLLIEHFGADSEAAEWLAQEWEPEELQHGASLRHYIETAWPNFEWAETRRKFLAEYSSYCLPTMLEPSRALEFVARCVVETGTAVLYRALHDYTDEPVLKQLTANIWSDEVRHYKHFYRYFNELNSIEGNGRWKISMTLIRRLAEIRNEDADCAIRHIFTARYPDETCDSEHYRTVSAQARSFVMQNTPVSMMIKMLLKPLDLPARWQPYVQRPLTSVVHRFMSA